MSAFDPLRTFECVKMEDRVAPSPATQPDSHSSPALTFVVFFSHAQFDELCETSAPGHYA